MNATEQYLFIVGGVLEFAGIMAVAWPDLLPYGERLSAWLGRAYRSAYQRTADLMRQFSRRPRGVIVRAPTATLALAGGGVTRRATVQPDATYEEKVEYLVKRDQDVQAMFDSLSAHVEERLGEVRTELKVHVASEMGRYRALRIGGTVALGLALACTIATGFV
jgi:hypothetical protein